jgi:putative ABC transport system substrate-binding protein
MSEDTRASRLPKPFSRVVLRSGAVWLSSVVVLGFGYFACRDAAQTDQKAEAVPESNLKVQVHRVAVFQAAPGEWADALVLGFGSALESAGFEDGRNLIIVHKSAGGDSATLATIAQSLAHSDFEIVYTLGTKASQEYFRAAQFVEQPPDMIFGAVTDPVAAGFYDGTISNPKGNLTGSQDLWPYAAQFSLIRTLLPTAQSIGVPYNPDEVNTQVSLSLARPVAAGRGFKFVEKPITQGTLDVAVQGLLAANVDAIYIPADTTAQENAPVIIAAANRFKKPVFTGISGIVDSGALATVGIDYTEVGRVNGRQAVEILHGRKEARTMAPEVASAGATYINLNAAAILGITVPDEVMKSATKSAK